MLLVKALRGIVYNKAMPFLGVELQVVIAGRVPHLSSEMEQSRQEPHNTTPKAWKPEWKISIPLTT